VGSLAGAACIEGRVPYLITLLAVLLAWALVRQRLSVVTIHEYERGLKFVHGAVREELTTGRHWYLRHRASVRTFDLRPTQLAVNGQEVLSKDGVAVKISLNATYRVADPRTAMTAASDFTAALYTALQQALRAAVSTSEVEVLLANRSDLSPGILEQARPVAERLGLVLEQVAVRDLTLPGELKKLFTQVVKARQEGLAALERARGETAALRNLANAAGMVESHPRLLELRALQVASQIPGTTLVLGVAGGAAVPGRGNGTSPAPGA
jgi:regulator of protease activity HflC (stomatin/prohibitin superfamily)